MDEEIVGIDEVGRGCLFGPVFAGAVLLNKAASIVLLKEGLTDSKRLTPHKRAKLVPLIKSFSIDWSLGQASANEIDSLGIRLATEKSMLRAIHGLSEQPSLIMIDGILPLRHWSGDQITIAKGDSKLPAIAAASVLAKEARDDLMKRLAINFPGYGLDRHMGYGTSIHRTALSKYGPCKLHRKTFLRKIIPDDFSVQLNSHRSPYSRAENLLSTDG